MGRGAALAHRCGTSKPKAPGFCMLGDQPAGRPLWADQQDTPEGTEAPISTDLLGLGDEDEQKVEEGAASGAPIVGSPVRRYGDWVNPVDDPGASIFTRSDPSSQEQAEAPQPPSEAVLTKEELESAVGVEAAASALESLVVTGEPSGAATTEPSAPVVEGIEENEFEVDYGGDEEDVEVEGEAPSAPPTDAEAAEQPNQQRQRRGTKAGKHVQQKAVGPKTTLISYASEDSSSSEELLPAEEGQDRPPTRQQRQRPRSPSSESSSSSHRSTSSGSQAQLPRGKREEPDILQGTIEAPIADIEPRQPAQRPPQEKRQRVQFGRRDIPTVQSTPLAKTAARQQGAAAPVAHQATTPAATEVKQEGKAKKSKPPPKAPTTVAAEDRERSRSTTNKVPYKHPKGLANLLLHQLRRGSGIPILRHLSHNQFQKGQKGPLLHLQQQLSLTKLHHKRYLSNGQGKGQLKGLPPALQALYLVDLHHIGIHLLQEISLQCRLEGITIPGKPGLRTFDLGTGHPSRLLWTGTVFWTSWLTTLVFLKKGHCNLSRHLTPGICPSNSLYCHLQDKKDQRASKINFVFSLETQLVEVCLSLVSG